MLRDNVVKTLFSIPVRWINFTFANRLISTLGFQLIGYSIMQGYIRCRKNINLGKTAQYHSSTDTIFASHDGFGSEFHDEKATLIHECTHAILDGFYGRRVQGQAESVDLKGRRSNLNILGDETMGYLAAAIYLVAAKAATEEGHSPTAAAIRIVRPKVDTNTPFQIISFSNQDVSSLQAAIKKDPMYANWPAQALHDGFSRAWW